MSFHAKKPKDMRLVTLASDSVSSWRWHYGTVQIGPIPWRLQTMTATRYTMMATTMTATRYTITATAMKTWKPTAYF